MDSTQEVRLTVPFVDLQRQNDRLHQELDMAVRRVIRLSAFVLGPAVEQFEREFAAYCGCRHCVAVNSGTTALTLALTAMGVGDGDEIIIPAMTFIATAEAVMATRARPVLCDIDPQTRTLAPHQVEKAITPRTRVILPVHLYGRPADMTAILELTDKHRIAVLEDAAQAHGARIGDSAVGSFGRAAAFSFYPSKNLGAFGEGGAIVTNDEEVAERARMLRDHGSRRKHTHELAGWNGRMEGIQGAVLTVKLPHLDSWNARRREIARAYNEGLGALPLTLPDSEGATGQVFHLYVVQSECRDELATFLAERDIGSGLHYPVPLHLQPALATLGYHKGDFPNAEELARTCLSLPVYPELADEQVAYVIRVCHEFFSNH